MFFIHGQNLPVDQKHYTGTSQEADFRKPDLELFMHYSSSTAWIQLQIPVSTEDKERHTTSGSPVEYTNTLYSPMTLLANDVRIKVASPRSPIFTEPVGPVMKMLSHFKSRWMIGGVLVCRKCSPFKICRHQLLNTFGFMTLKRFKYL